MVLEEQIQLFCLRHISKYLIIFLLILFFFILFLTSLFNKNINIDNQIIEIKKGENLKNITSNIFTNHNKFEKYLFYQYIIIWDKFFDKIDYGKFSINDNANLIDLINIISKPSNVYEKFTVIDGWQKYQLIELLNLKFNDSIKISYQDILADTYLYRSTDNLDKLFKLMINFKNDFFIKYKDNKILNKFSVNDIFIIASLVEKEGINDEDKKLISSVIFNRLNKNMKLQIDASTIFAITKGKYKFSRKLTYEDLKIKDSYNTYYIKGLPPNPICFVGKKTIEIVLEDNKSDFLFYFYNENMKKHIYSKTFKDHKRKLKEYRNNNE